MEVEKAAPAAAADEDATSEKAVTSSRVETNNARERFKNAPGCDTFSRPLNLIDARLGYTN
jgi:hypothetical protein